MKKMITSFVAAAALLTSAHADFDFGDIFKDMKKAAATMHEDSVESTVKISKPTKKASDFNFGDVFKDLKKSKTAMSESQIKKTNIKPLAYNQSSN